MATALLAGSVGARGQSTTPVFRPQHPMVLKLPAPDGLTVAQQVSACTAHGGFAAGLACKAGIPNGLLAFVWNWNGSGQGPIDGYRFYEVTRPIALRTSRHTLSPSQTLVYDQRNGSAVTIVVLKPPAGGFAGHCYDVTAYRTGNESDPSAQMCVTRQQTIVLASPSVVPPPPTPRAPNHVVIHVTGDSFPDHTIVAAGGDVTWINDDTDEHSVYGPAGSFVGDLYPKGGRFTTTFRDIGRNYSVPYLCEYHVNMRGTIDVVVNK